MIEVNKLLEELSSIEDTYSQEYRLKFNEVFCLLEDLVESKKIGASEYIRYTKRLLNIKPDSIEPQRSAF